MIVVVVVIAKVIVGMDVQLRVRRCCEESSNQQEWVLLIPVLVTVPASSHLASVGMKITFFVN